MGLRTNPIEAPHHIKKKMISLYKEDGLGGVKIARWLKSEGIYTSRTTVLNTLREWEVQIRSRRASICKKIPVEVKTKIIKWYKEDYYEPIKIAKLLKEEGYNISPFTIGQRLPDWGVQIRARRGKKNITCSDCLEKNKCLGPQKCLKYVYGLKLLKVGSLLEIDDDYIKDALDFFIKIIKSESRVSNKITLLAFCLYYSIKKRTGITIQEICKAFQENGHRVGVSSILKNGINYKRYCPIKSISEARTSQDYLERIFKRFNRYKKIGERLKERDWNKSEEEYLEELENKSREMLKGCPLNLRGGRNPFILSGAIVYTADKLMGKKYYREPVLSQKIISEVTGITENSIQNHYVKLLKPLFFKTNTVKN